MTPAQRHALQTFVDCGGARAATCARLGCSRLALRQRLQRVRDALGVRDVAQAVVVAWRAGLIGIAVADAPLVCRPTGARLRARGAAVLD